jgi:hypothetical protein
LLKVAWKEEHGGPLTPEYLNYCRHDVRATWALYQRLRDLYRQHGISRPLWSIYSEASLGKGYLQDLGIPRFMQQRKTFPKAVQGYGMMAYYGGRSEVHIRQQPVEVLHCDFRSEYPTVNALMGLQELLLARKIAVRPCTAETQQLLHTLRLEHLQRPETWRLLRRLVKVKPCGDILPVRSTFGMDIAATNIALPYVSGPPTWYTLADVIASYLLTGRVPEIVEAIELVPVGRVQTKPWRLFGEERYTIDLSKQDFFTAVINLRTQVQAEQQAMPDGTAAWDHLDSLQRALKLLANSTSYGVLVEMNQSERLSRRQQLTCYDEVTHHISMPVLETPGPYFCGAIGTLIPAAGRLLLALCERLAADRGLSYAFCDTDSMAFARPEGMAREDFRQRVQGIVDYFIPLSPYQDKPPLLQYEKANHWPAKSDTLGPLHCLAISAKRYVLYTRLEDGTYRIRKFSSHGVGTWHTPKGYVPRSDIPEPCEDVYKLGGDRWMYDLWYGAIEHLECLQQRRAAGDQIEVWERPVRLHGDWLGVPARSQVTISTRHLYDQFRAHFPTLRPFNFIIMLPALDSQTITSRFMAVWSDEGGDVAGTTALYDGLACQAFYESPEGIRRMDSHAIVNVEHKTLAECLRDYYEHAEAKAACPEAIGALDRSAVTVVEHVYCGKESNDVLTELVDESESIMPYPDAQVFGRRGLATAIRAHGVGAVAAALPAQPPQKRTLYKILTGDQPNRGTARRILASLDACPPTPGCCADGREVAPSAYEAQRLQRAARRREYRASHHTGQRNRAESPDIIALREALGAMPRAHLAAVLGLQPRWVRWALQGLSDVPASTRHRLATIAEDWTAEQIARDEARYDAELRREMRRSYAQMKKAARDEIRRQGRIRQPRAESELNQYRLWVPVRFRNVGVGGLPLDIMLQELQQRGYYHGAEDLDEFSEWLHALVG